MIENTNVVYGNPDLAYLFDDEKISVDKLPKGYTLDMYNKIMDINDVNSGDTIVGTLVSETDNEILFEIGAKDFARVAKNKSELSFFEGKKVGDTMEMLILSKTENPYSINASVADIYEARAHESLSEIDNNAVALVYVKELTDAGYNVDLLHDGTRLDAFMPQTLAGINKLHDTAKEALVGKELKVMIESFSREKGTYIVSRRRYLKTLIPKAMENLEYGKVYTGYITGSAPFGVFVEFEECLTGLIHKTNINPAYAETFQDIPDGMEIDFYIKEVIKNKIILTQILTESLWDELEQGDVVKGRIKEVRDFGMLVDLDDETTGLIPTTILLKDNTTGEIGDEINVTIMTVDRAARKIYLKEKK